MEKKFNLETSVKTEKNLNRVLEFCSKILAPDEQPYFISDSATIYDVSILDDKELLGRIFEAYGILLPSSQLSLPIFELVEIIYGKR